MFITMLQVAFVWDGKRKEKPAGQRHRTRQGGLLFDTPVVVILWDYIPLGALKGATGTDGPGLNHRRSQKSLGFGAQSSCPEWFQYKQSDARVCLQ